MSKQTGPDPLPPAQGAPSAAELEAKRILDAQPLAKGAGRMPPSPRPKSESTTPRDPNRFILTPSVRGWIKRAILSWDEKSISWEAICDLVRGQFRKRFPDLTVTRQSLSRYSEIKTAYDVTRSRLKQDRLLVEDEGRAAAGKSKKLRKSSGMEEYFENKIRTLERRIMELEARDQFYKRRFVTWQRNAVVAGMTIQELDKPLTDIDRGQQDE